MQLVGSMFRRAAALAKEHGYHERGYRTVFNTNREAGQTVFHIHLHLLAGRGLGGRRDDQTRCAISSDRLLMTGTSGGFAPLPPGDR